MTASDIVRRVENELRRTADLIAAGSSEREIAQRVSDRSLLRLKPGWYVEAATWKGWFPEQRHLAAVLAVHRSAVEPPLFTHHSAAVLLGLPLWGMREQPVHIAAERSRTWSPAVHRHGIPVDPLDTGSVAGIRCTSPDRTLHDLANHSSEELLLGCADVVLRRAVEAGRDPDPERVEAWRRRMRGRADAAAGRQGNRRFRRIIELADPCADSVLESVSRLRFEQLGFAVELQTHVDIPGHHGYDVDFLLIGLGIFGEADGDQKYSDPAMLGGRTPADVVLREKKRDNLISGVSGNRMIHWGSRDVRTIEHFTRMLRAFGIPTPHRTARERDAP